MKEYSEYSTSSLGVSGNEGIYIKTLGFQILKEEGLQESIHALVIEHMDDDEIDTSETGCSMADIDPMYIEYDTYTEMIHDLLGNGSTESPRSIPDEIFEGLVNDGFVSNGFHQQRSYYMSKYDTIWMTNDCLHRAVKTDEIYLHPEELADKLKFAGLVDLIDDSTIKVSPQLAKLLKVKKI